MAKKTTKKSSKKTTKKSSGGSAKSGSGGTGKKASTKKSTSNTPGTYITATKPTQIAAYKNTETAPAAYVPGTYTSEYGDRINQALDTVTNFKYDPLQDASYQALAKVYGQRGNIAAKDTLADAASLNGGMQSSYAVSAAQQARNQYNQELAALIPELEQNAFNRASATYTALRNADDTAYGRFRDTEGDRQWKYEQDYGAYRDRVGDNQWKYEQDYGAYRDQAADYQWGTDFNNSLYQYKMNLSYQKERDKVADKQWAKEYALSKKGSSGGGSSGGSRRSSRSSGGSYSSSTTSNNSTMPITKEEYNNIFNKNKKKTYTVNKKSTSGYTSYGGTKQGGRMVK